MTPCSLIFIDALEEHAASIFKIEKYPVDGKDPCQNLTGPEI
jgi:hypothetical protein